MFVLLKTDALLSQNSSFLYTVYIAHYILGMLLFYYTRYELLSFPISVTRGKLILECISFCLERFYDSRLLKHECFKDDLDSSSRILPLTSSPAAHVPPPLQQFAKAE